MKKTLSILLAVVMLLGVLPFAASAETSKKIRNISITDLDEPIIGEHPDFDVTIENAEEGLTCQVIWGKLFDDNKVEGLSPDAKFEKGERYLCIIGLRSTVYGFCYNTAYDGGASVKKFAGTIKVNGKRIVTDNTTVRNISDKFANEPDKKESYLQKYPDFAGDDIAIIWWDREAKEGTHYTVSFETYGYGDTIEPVSVLSGKTVNKPKLQFVRGKEFDGWYTDPGYNTLYDFSSPVTKDITLYAKWKKADPGSSDKTEPITDPEPVVSDYVCPFVDVAEDEWYFPWVSGAHKMGLINGKDDTHYKPDDNMTYAEAIKLAACMNQLKYNGEITLTNGEEHWYDTYVDYCIENGIIAEDYSAVINESIDRQTYAAIFSKALPAEALEAKNDVPDGSIPDVQNDNPYCDAIYTLYRAGIVNGSDSRGTFNPTNYIKRSEVAAILNRMMDATVRVGAPSELLK